MHFKPPLLLGPMAVLLATKRLCLTGALSKSGSLDQSSVFASLCTYRRYRSTSVSSRANNEYSRSTLIGRPGFFQSSLIGIALPIVWFCLEVSQVSYSTIGPRLAQAHWEIGLIQNLQHTEHIGAEPFWHNARFPINTDKATALYFSSPIEVNNVSDVLDGQTDQPFTKSEWRSFIDDLHSNITLALCPRRSSLAPKHTRYIR